MNTFTNTEIIQWLFAVLLFSGIASAQAQITFTETPGSYELDTLINKK